MELMDVGGTIIGAAFEVHNRLGSGFLEKVYENSLAEESRSRGLKVDQQWPIPVSHKVKVVGEYFADLLVNERLICEIKAVEQITKLHEVQLVNYLVAAGTRVGLLINFGRSVQIRRKRRLLEPDAPNPVNPVNLV